MAFKYLTGTIVPIADREWAESMPREHMPTCFGCDSSAPTMSSAASSGDSVGKRS